MIQSPGGVEARAERKSNGAGVDGLHAADLNQGAQAGALGAAQLLQAARDEHTILTEQRREIGHGAQCDQIEQVVFGERHFVLVGLGVDDEQGLRDFEGQTDSGEFFEGVRTSGLFGIDQRVGIGQIFGGHVMIADDQIQPDRFGEGHFAQRAHATIDRDHQPHAVFLEML